MSDGGGGGAAAWGGLISAGAGLAAAIMSNPYHPVKQYDYQVAKPVDNSTQYYNKAYAEAIKRKNAFELMFKGERTITAANLRAVKSRTQVGINQDIAESEARMNAAVRGSKATGSVSDSIEQTYANAAYRFADIAVEERQMVEKGLSDVYAGNQGSTMAKIDTSVQNNFTGGDSPVTRSGGYSLSGSIMGALGDNFGGQFWQDLGLAMEGSGGEQVAEQDYFALETGSVVDYGNYA